MAAWVDTSCRGGERGPDENVDGRRRPVRRVGIIEQISPDGVIQGPGGPRED